MKKIVAIILITSICFINVWPNTSQKRHDKKKIFTATASDNNAEYRLERAINLDIRDVYLNTLGTNVTIRTVPMICYSALLFVLAVVNIFVYSPGGNSSMSFFSYIISNIFTIPGLFEVASFIATPLVHHLHYNNIINNKASRMTIDKSKLLNMTKIKYAFSYILVLVLTGLQIANVYLMYRVF